VFTASYYQNGASVGGVIEQKTGAALSRTASRTLLKSFNEEHAGPGPREEDALPRRRHGVQAATLPLSDAQFLETRRFQVEEICRWFGVPQHLVQMLTESNYAISYTADKNFVEHTLRPIAVLMEQEANLRLFGARARGTIYSRLNLSALMRGDPKVRGEWYKAMVNAGVMSINEVRALEELNSIGPEGDEHYLQTSMTTLGRIAEGSNITQPAAAAPDAPSRRAGGRTRDTQPQENVIRRDALAWWRNAQRSQSNG
jgi:HK97 family phage portal protein